MRSCPKAEALCETKARHRLVKTGPIDAKRAQKANWSDPYTTPALTATACCRCGRGWHARRVWIEGSGMLEKQA